MKLNDVVVGKTYHWDGTDGEGILLDCECPDVKATELDDEAIEIEDRYEFFWYVSAAALSEIDQ